MNRIPRLTRTLLLTFLFVASTAGCRHHLGKATPIHADGVYRGAFFDRDHMEVGIEFRLKDQIVTEFNYRHLAYGGINFLRPESEPLQVVRQQWMELADAFIGKKIQDRIDDLYDPQSVIETEIDGLTAATVRSGKLISAIRDALNRGVYAK